MNNNLYLHAATKQRVESFQKSQEHNLISRSIKSNNDRRKEYIDKIIYLARMKINKINEDEEMLKDLNIFSISLIMEIFILIRLMMISLNDIEGDKNASEFFYYLPYYTVNVEVLNLIHYFKRLDDPSINFKDEWKKGQEIKFKYANYVDDKIMKEDEDDEEKIQYVLDKAFFAMDVDDWIELIGSYKDQQRTLTEKIDTVQLEEKMNIELYNKLFFLMVDVFKEKLKIQDMEKNKLLIDEETKGMENQVLNMYLADSESVNRIMAEFALSKSIKGGQGFYNELNDLFLITRKNINLDIHSAWKQARKNRDARRKARRSPISPVSPQMIEEEESKEVIPEDPTIMVEKTPLDINLNFDIDNVSAQKNNRASNLDIEKADLMIVDTIQKKRALETDPMIEPWEVKKIGIQLDEELAKNLLMLSDQWEPEPGFIAEEVATVSQTALNEAIVNYRIPMDKITNYAMTYYGAYIRTQIKYVMADLFKRKKVPWTLTIHVDAVLRNMKIAAGSEWIGHFDDMEYDYTVNDPSVVGDTIQIIWSDILKWSEEILGDQSGIMLVGFNEIEIRAVSKQYGYFGSYIPTPECLVQKKAVANPQNLDDRCLVYCILMHMHSKDINSTLFKQWGRDGFNKDWKKIHNVLEETSKVQMRGITFPVKISDIPQIEYQNSIHINIFGIEVYEDPKQKRKPRSGPDSKKEVGFKLFPIYSSWKGANIRYGEFMNVLVLKEKVGELEKSHFLYVHNLDSLVRESGPGRSIVCVRCLNISLTQVAHDTHFKECIKNNGLRYSFPTKPEELVIKFKHFHYAVPVPFIIYSDFESILVQDVLIKSGGTVQDCKRHVPSSWAMRTVFNNDLIGGRDETVCSIYDRMKSDFGNGCVKTFIEELLQEAGRITRYILNGSEAIKMDQQDWLDYQRATRCYMCSEVFEPSVRNQVSKNAKVRDHCHITGKYRGAAHSICNTMAKNKSFIPVVFHNLSGYDLHLFIKDLFAGEISVIAKSSEKYTTLNIKPDFFVRVTDNDASLVYPLVIDKATFQGLSDQLKQSFKSIMKIRFIDSLSFLSGSLENLAKSLPSNHRYTFAMDDILRKKGPYPYEYMDSFEKFEETKLPGRDDFFSLLTRKELDYDSYVYGFKIWDRYNCKTIKDYHMLYMETDVNLLAEIFENFRRICYSNYKIDPAYYITTPALAWDACLKYTKVNLEVITDMEVYNFFEAGIRGGVSTCGEFRHVETENTDYEIKYYDVNNLYGSMMANKLPTGGFEWILDPHGFLEDNSMTALAQDKEFGYVFEVDLIYPVELHDLHNAFPLAPVHWKGKLMCTLNDKSNYILSVVTLNTYLNYGLKLGMVYRILKYRHSPWMSDYIWFNFNKRAEAKEHGDQSLINFYKLMNNSVYGKTLENVKKRRNIKICRTDTELYNTQRDFYYKTHKVFRNDMVLVHLQSKEIILDKPIYIGFCVLEYAKDLMYRFYYGKFKEYYGNYIKMLYTDTDSFIMLMKKSDTYEASNQKMRPYINEGVLGMLKDEYPDKEITGYVGLKSKSYALQFDKRTEKIVNKGIPVCVNNTELTFNDFKEVLYQRTSISTNFFRIMSKGHEMYSILVEKKMLDGKDSKRFIYNNENKTWAWGHVFERNCNAVVQQINNLNNII